MIRKVLLWLFGQRPDPGPLFPMPTESAETAPLLTRAEKEDQMLAEIDAQLSLARGHLEAAERRKKAR